MKRKYIEQKEFVHCIKVHHTEAQIMTKRLPKPLSYCNFVFNIGSLYKNVQKLLFLNKI